MRNLNNQYNDKKIRESSVYERVSNFIKKIKKLKSTQSTYLYYFKDGKIDVLTKFYHEKVVAELEKMLLSLDQLKSFGINESRFYKIKIQRLKKLSKKYENKTIIQGELQKLYEEIKKILFEYHQLEPPGNLYDFDESSKIAVFNELEKLPLPLQLKDYLNSNKDLKYTQKEVYKLTNNKKGTLFGDYIWDKPTILISTSHEVKYTKPADDVKISINPVHNKALKKICKEGICNVQDYHFFGKDIKTTTFKNKHNENYKWKVPTTSITNLLLKSSCQVDRDFINKVLKKSKKYYLKKKRFGEWLLKKGFKFYEKNFKYDLNFEFHPQNNIGLSMNNFIKDKRGVCAHFARFLGYLGREYGIDWVIAEVILTNSYNGHEMILWNGELRDVTIASS